MEKPQTHYRVCNYCEAMCGVKVVYDPSAEHDEDKINITPDQDDPFSKGAMCPKASALGPLHYDSDKLRAPVKKVDGEWLTISWDEAYEMVAQGLKSVREKHGANAIASYLGNPVVHNLGMILFIKTLTKAIGSKNVFSATSMDQLPHHFASHFMFGNEMRIPVPDIDRSDYMIVMGANPLASNGSIMTAAGVNERLRKIQGRGGKLIVIDPRKTETAKIASEHHFIKPARDVFFLLSLLHILFRDDKVRLGRLTEHVVGIEQLKPLIKDYTPAYAASMTGISEKDIERIAAEYSSHERAVLYGRMGLSTQPHGGLCQWLINTINIVSGHFDTAGGMMFPSPAIEVVRSKKQANKVGRWRSRVRGMKEFYGELPVSAMAEEMETEGEGQVKAFVSVCGNPVLSSPNGKRLDDLLPEMDFMVSIDNYINETTRHADLILPTPSGLEIDHYDLVFNMFVVRDNAKFSPALIPVDKDRPYDWQILKEISRRLSKKGLSLFDRIATPRMIVNLGLMLGPYGKLSHPKRLFSGLSLKKLIDSKHGISLGPLKQHVPAFLTTPSRKIHLAEDVFLSRLAELNAETATPENEGDFLLIGRRNISTTNSWMHQVKHLSASKQVRCTVMMHPSDAKRLYLVDGEDIKVISRVGDIVIPVEITVAMMPGVLSIPHGFGHTRKGTKIRHAEAKPGVSVNDITDHERVDKLTGNAAFSGQTVQVEKISDVMPTTTATGKPLLVLFGTQSGNAEMIAADISKLAGEHDLLVEVMDMNDADAQILSAAERILLIVSTFGEGDMPDNAQGLWDEISQNDSLDFSKTSYAVLALGDRSYENFCESGKQWDTILKKRGAQRTATLLECDVDYVEDADQWISDILPKIGEQGDQSIITIDLEDEHEKPVKYNRRNPFEASLLTKRNLNKDGSSKQTIHYEFSLEGYEGSDYTAGDVFYIIPENNVDLVDELLVLLGSDGNEYLQGQDKSLRTLLTHDLEIRLPSKKLLNLVCGEKTLSGKELYGKDVIDVLKLYPDRNIELEEIVKSLPPLMPRAYSISSSIRKHASEVHLTVATVSYVQGTRTHLGVASGYLAEYLQEGMRVKCYFTANKAFSVPEDDNAPMIMIGPGTGIAPFRAFLEEREMRRATGENWLFFGDRTAENDFLYQQELETMKQGGVLNHLDLAFSRDQEEKIYVQQRMLENADRLFEWLERGAYFFVCGDKNHMAKDVESALHQIIEKAGKMSAEQASDYVQTLKQDKRYVLDVY